MAQTIVKEKPVFRSPKKNANNTDRLSKYWIGIIIYVSVIALLNIIFIVSQSASDFYVDHVFAYTGGVLSRITGLFSFSCGEVLITLGIVLIFAALVLCIITIIVRKSMKLRRFLARYLKVLLVIVLSVVLVYTLNCTVMYCSTPMSFANGKRDFDIETLEAVRNDIVVQCNELGRSVERDENYAMKFSGDPAEAAADALLGISDEFPRLSGYYPPAKAMMGSYYMYKSGIIGVYFPFSMEANYSSYVSDSYLPHVFAHEYSHLKGYIYESEANFMSYIACRRSDDPAVRYSGLLCVLSYIDGDYKSSVGEKRYNEQPQIENYVIYDNNCYDQKTYEQLVERDKKEQPKAAEIAEKVGDKAMDAYMEVLDYEPNYSEVTLLILQYYTQYDMLE